MLAEDARALHAYILSLPASEQPNRAHELAWFLRWRFAAQVWKWLFFSAGEFEQLPAQSAQWESRRLPCRSHGTLWRMSHPT